MQTPVARTGLIHVHDQNVVASNSVVDVLNTVLTMNVESDDGGKIIISITRHVLDSKLMDAELPFEVSINGKIMKRQESINPFNHRVVSLYVKPNFKILSISGSGHL